MKLFRQIILIPVTVVLLFSHSADARRMRNTDSCSLKRYDDEILNTARDIVWREMQNSSVKNAVTYHNSIHVNSLLDFIDRVISKMKESNNETVLLYKIDRIQFLARIAVYFHDAGVYVAVGDKFCLEGHEERSKAIIGVYSKLLGLSQAESEIVQLMINFTKLKVGEEFKEEALLIDEIITTIEVRGKLSDWALQYIKDLIPGLDLTNNDDLDLLHDALIVSKIIAIGDVYGNSQNYLSQIPGLWLEYRLLGLAADTIIEQIANGVYFLEDFTEDQRLNYLLYGEYGIDRFIPDSFKYFRGSNIDIMRQYRDYIDKMESEEFTVGDRFEFEALIDSLGSELVSDEIKDIIKKEIDMLLEIAAGNAVSHPLPLNKKI